MLCLKLKHSNEFDNLMPTVLSSHGPFKLDKWITLMIRWIITDDQVCFAVYFLADCLWYKAINVIESKEFQDFILYGRDNITECDLPHQTNLIGQIFKAYEEEHCKLLDNFKVGHCYAVMSLYF